MADNPPMTAAPSIPLPPVSARDAAAPLSPEHYQQLALAQKRFAKIRRAIRVALTDGIITAVIAGSALLMSVASLSPVHILVSLALCGAAVASFYGVRLLRQADPRAARLLGINQVAIFVVIALYCVYSVCSPTSFGAELTAALGDAREVRDVFPNLEHLVRTIILVIYGCVFVCSLLCQGLAALYYFTRARHLRAYRQETPPWILQLQQFQSLR